MAGEMLFPTSLEDKTTDNFQPQSPQQAAALRVVRGLIDESAEVNYVHGIWLYGPFGTGKTHLQAALYQGLRIPEGQKLWIPPYKTTAKYALEEAMKPSGRDAEQPLRTALIKSQAIFIDELTITDMDALLVKYVTEFFQLAYQRNLRLFISSNHSMAEVSTRIQALAKNTLRDRDSNRALETQQFVSEEVAGRIQSRLSEMMTPIEILGEDYRAQIARRALDQYQEILAQETSSFGRILN